MQNSPSMKQVGEGDYGTSNFTSPTCQSTGSIDACCPTPALDCSRTEVVVTPSELGPINAVDNDDAGDVVDFFTNEDWMIYFPQLESETEVLTDIFNGLYTWNKRHYGDYVWVEFVAEDDDNFSLPLKIEE